MNDFKVGDWVRDIISGNIHQVHNSDIVNGEYSQVIKWQPKASEWVWVWYKNRNPILAKFVELSDNKNNPYVVEGLMNSLNGSFYTSNIEYPNCEPFIGTLPTFL